MQRLVVLLPEDWDERRDRGLVLAELGDVAGAAADLAAYVEHCPAADDARAIGERLAQLRDHGSRLLH
jgi:regulator of sirC expression with transglutaminase-like and TPR domain